jgi:hypothetical protein
MTVRRRAKAKVNAAECSSHSHVSELAPVFLDTTLSNGTEKQLFRRRVNAGALDDF